MENQVTMVWVADVDVKEQEEAEADTMAVILINLLEKKEIMQPAAEALAT